ncbi:MAG: hypothetical protein CSA62_00440 [Planctomycetota bacterium]|nr:MAG: hypothetical protein CSA62_00440 [Planctomycetota bacterium]
MKILVIVHQFLPRHSTGTEVYTYKLAKALQQRGHELRVFAAHRDASRAQFEMEREEFDGLPIYAAVHNYQFEDYRSIYVIPEMERHLESILDEFQPDVAHIQHLHTHSIGYLPILKSRGIPILFTLAEYFLLCVRSWLVKPDFSLCAGPDFEECAKCNIQWPAPKRESWLAKLLALDPKKPKPKYSLRRFLDKRRRRFWLEGERRAVARRWNEHIEALGHVDQFIAPSRFLREQFIKHGMIAADRIEYSDYGFDHSPFANCSPRSHTEPPLVVGFIGSIAEQKGVDVLVDACRGFSPDQVRLEVHGDLGSFPKYAAKVQAPPLHEGIRFFGRYDNRRIGEILSRFDVLVVPSLWFENSPLTIHESFMAGVPVLTGDQGGMAELVEHEKGGLQFRIGDAQDLRKQLQRLLDEEGLLARLRASIPSVKDIAADAEDTERRLLDLIAGRS